MLKTFAILIAAGLALAACQTDSTNEPPMVRIADQRMTDKQAFAAARAAVLASLKDPDSAKFSPTFTRKTVAVSNPVFALQLIAVDQLTEIVCGTVNSRNSFGAYAGPAVFAYRIARGDVFLDAGGERLGSIWCVDSASH